MHNIELFCLEIMDYNLNDLSSFSILQIILNNGILLENEILEKNNFKILENLYKKIFEINSLFFLDNRFVDFSPIDIVMSLISFGCEIFNFNSWNIIRKFYNNDKSYNRNNCYIVIKR